MKYALITAFAVMALAQWIVPVRLMNQKQEVLAKGTTWLFKTQPVDPSDPFAGRYILLNFEISEYIDSSKNDLKNGEKVFVLLTRDELGHAKIQNVTNHEPTNTGDYVRANLQYRYLNEDSTYTMRIEFPFNEFYMEESKAPQAELIYNQANRDSLAPSFAKVKVWKGDAVTEDVLINNRSISSYIKQ